MSEAPFRIAWTPTAKRTLARLPEKVAAAAVEFIYGSLAENPYRVGKPLRRELEGLAGHINGRHAAPDWTPVRYVNRNFAHDVLTGFYRMAALAIVTPLRDGMNLVAKEFVAAQDEADPGVLVLSRFAGAASELPEALLVNPYDLDGVADAVAQAATMPLAERCERWRSMMDTLERHDITAWRTSFLEALAG